MFEGLKTMKDIVQGSIEAVKATGQLDKMVAESRKEYKEELTDADRKLFKQYKKLKEQYEAEQDMDKANAMIEKIEADEVAYLLSLTENQALPGEFRMRIQEVVDAYSATNADISERIEELAMKHADDEEEKGFIQNLVKKAKRK